MPELDLRFYEELNDFLPAGRRKRTYRRHIPENCTVSEIIRAEGVPLDAVELVLANGRSVGLDYRPEDGQRLAVYPVFETLELNGLTRIHDRPLRQPRFVADAHLGKLAEYLRMLGFDTLFRNDFSDDELVRISREQRRILLSRDRGLLKRAAVTRGYFVGQTGPAEQLGEVLERFDLYGRMRPLGRCIKCNSPLEAVTKAQVMGRLPPDTARHYKQFWQCTGCARVYWKGSHYLRMRRRIAALRRRWAERQLRGGT